LYAIGLGALAPLSGFLVLVAGEAFRVFRLMQRSEDHAQKLVQSSFSTPPAASERGPEWRNAFRQEAVKWGILLTMIVFVTTLKDRVAEVLAAACFLVGLLFNASIFRPRKREQLR
jgi:hypothetical protein